MESTGNPTDNLDATFSSMDIQEQDMVLSALRHAGGRRFWPMEG